MQIIAPTVTTGIKPMKKTGAFQSFIRWFDKKNSAVQSAIIVAIISLVGAIITGCFQLASALISKPVSIIITATLPLEKDIPPTATEEFLNFIPNVTIPTQAIPETGSTKIDSKDGATLVYVPEGKFTMGSANGSSNEQPTHIVDLKAYWIDQTEVTNAMYTLCVQDEKCKRPRDPNHFSDLNYANHPVVYVSWEDATTYCSWAGRRLPTEAEWEKAARGTDQRVYPWGNNTPDHNLLNYEGSIGDTTIVKKYPEGVSPYGAYDMAGHVWEWVSSISKPYPYNTFDGREDLNASDARIVRGGSWEITGNIVSSTSRNESYPLYAYSDYGFRCAQLHNQVPLLPAVGGGTPIGNNQSCPSIDMISAIFKSNIPGDGAQYVCTAAKITTSASEYGPTPEGSVFYGDVFKVVVTKDNSNILGIPTDVCYAYPPEFEQKNAKIYIWNVNNSNIWEEILNADISGPPKSICVTSPTTGIFSLIGKP